MIRFSRRKLVRQALATIAVLLAFVLRVELARHAVLLPPYVTFYPIVLLAALLGGLWAGIFATGLSALLADYFLLEPIGRLTIHSASDVVGMLIFCFSGLAVTTVAEFYRRSHNKLAAYEMQQAVLRERWKADEERKVAESIRAERQRFLDVLEALPTMICLLTLDHRIAFANRSFREKFGASQGELCYQACFGCTRPCDFCESYAVIENGRPHHWEVITRDGSLIDVYDYPFRDLDGSSLILQVNIDITERRRTETELKEHHEELEELVAERTQQLQAANDRLEADIRERERVEQVLGTTLQRFYAILSNLNAGVLLVTDEGKTEFANQAFCEIFGLGGSAASQVGIESTVMVDRIKSAHQNPEWAVRRIHEIVAQGKPVLNEEISLRNGRTFLRDYAPLTIAGISYGRLWVHTNITERERAMEALRESRAKLEAALASMTDSVIITDTDGRFVEFNNAFATFYRFKSKAECAKNFDEFARIFEVSMADGAPAPREMYAIQRALRGEMATDAEYTLRRRDTGESWIGSLAFGPIRDLDGKIIGSVVTARDITETKRVETRLRRFYETDLFAILYWKIDGGVVDANNKFLELTGYSREDLLAGQLNWSKITPPEYWPLDEDARRQIAENGVHLPYEKQFIRKDGRRVWGVFSAAAYEDDRTQGVSFILDITERKLAETALQESEKRYRDLFNSMTEGFCVIEVLFDSAGKPEDYRFVEVNGAFEKQTGLRDAVGKRMRELAPDHEAYWFEIYGQIALTGAPAHFMNEATALNRFYDVYAYRVGEAEQRRVAIVLNDFSDYKRAQEALAEARRQAERSASQLRTIFDNIEERLYVCDHDGNLIVANDVARKTYGRDEKAVAPSVAEMDRKIDVLDIDCHPLAKYDWPVSRILRGELVHSMEVRVRFRETGDERILSCNGSAIRDSNGRIEMAVLTSADITERKRAEDQLKRLNRTLKARSDSDQAILHATDESGFLAEVCRIIISDCGYAMVWIGAAERDERKTVRPVAYSGFEEGYLEALEITWDESEHGYGPTGTAIRTGKPSLCRNMLTDPGFLPWRADAIKRGYASSLVIPLMQDEQAWGAITIYSREPDAFSEGEICLLTELAGDLEFGVQTLRLRAAHANAEKELRESEELLGLFVEHAPAALAMFDRDMGYLHASRRWRADYGLGDRDLRGISHYEVFPEIPRNWKEAHQRGLAGEVLGGDGDRFERPDGSEQWIRWEIRPWCHADGKVGGIVIFTEEISERIKAQEALLESEKMAFQRQQLQALAERLQQAREEERTMVARDLHDQIGQILTAIKMDMAWVVRHISQSENGVEKRLQASIELINEGVRSVRKICSGLRPGILDDLGLAAAIEWQANEFASRTGIGCKVTIPTAELSIDSDRATAIFRIFQECLTNVARHAEAQSVSASLSTQDEDLVLKVQDDGKGFDEAETTGSLGILGMKERAKACGGSLQVLSSPGSGTVVTVRVPQRGPSIEREDHAYSDRG